jgi:hypothetical protein
MNLHWIPVVICGLAVYVLDHDNPYSKWWRPVLAMLLIGFSMGFAREEGYIRGQRDLVEKVQEIRREESNDPF